MPFKYTVLFCFSSVSKLTDLTFSPLFDSVQWRRGQEMWGEKRMNCSSVCILNHHYDTQVLTFEG